MNYSSLEEVYGKPFGQRVPVTRERKEAAPIAKPEFTSMTQKSEESRSKNQALIDSVTGSLPLDKDPETETFAVREPMRVREKFSSSQPASVFEGVEQSEKLSRILRLIEQNRTGYERPAIQDMVLYIATGVFFLFTFDTFVALGTSMRRR